MSGSGDGRLFTIQDRIRWSDVDPAGIIFYGSYVRFFEIAEMEMFRAAGVPYGRVFERFDMWLPRVHLEVDFHHPARMDDELRIGVYFTRFGTSSLRIHFDALHVGGGCLAATGHEVLVCTSRDTLEPRPLPDELREHFAPFHLTEAEAREQLHASGAGSGG